MKEISKKDQLHFLLVIAPLALILALMFVFSGPFGGSASAVYGEYGEYGCPSWDTALYPPITSPWGAGYWDPPNPCSSDPWGMNFNPATGEDPADLPFDGYVKPDELINAGNTGLLQDNANKGTVHIIDVRTPQEDVDGDAPCFNLFGLPVYSVSNAQHPVWTWPDGTPEESYQVPFFNSVYYAGTARMEDGALLPQDYWVWNVRPGPNPNFLDIGYGSYMRALLNQGEVDANDTFVVMCQSGWRASFAATVLKNLPQFHDANVKVLYGGMLGWSDDYFAPGDHDNVPGPNALPKTQYVTGGQYKYDTQRLTNDGQPVMWNGSEPHAGVKPEWYAAFGAGDYKLALENSSPRWASYTDYHYRVLSVDYTIRNNPPDPPGPLNYPPPQGTCNACSGEPVYQDPHGPAYNAVIAQAPATNGAVALNLPAAVAGGSIAPNLTSTATVRYQMPAGVSVFNSYPMMMSNDVPDPTATAFGPNLAMMFTYMHTNWESNVTDFPAPPPTDTLLDDDLVFIGNAGGNNLKVVDVASGSVVNTIGTGTSLNKNHGVLMDGDPRYVWSANDGVVDQKLKVTKFDLGTLTEVAAFEQYVPGYSGGGLCGIEFDQNDPSKNMWALAMSAVPGQGGAWEINQDTGFTGEYVDPGTGADNRATCGIGWNSSGTVAYASLMVAKKTTEVAWPGAPIDPTPTGRAATHNATIHIIDTNKEAGLIYASGGNSTGVGSSLDVIDMTTMNVVGSTPLEGFNPHSVTLTHNNGIIYAHSRIGAPNGTGALLILDVGAGSAGGTQIQPTLMAIIPDEGTGGSCGNDVVKKSDFCAKPSLGLSRTSTYWASYADYTAGLLSVDYSVSNQSALAAAHNTAIAGTVNSMGVTMASSTAIGNVPGGGSVPLTIKYNVPSGVVSFGTTVYATAGDLCGNSYTYPGPYPEA
jgi:rhodanese-related sulfurtransferase